MPRKKQHGHLMEVWAEKGRHNVRTDCRGGDIRVRRSQSFEDQEEDLAYAKAL